MAETKKGIGVLASLKNRIIGSSSPTEKRNTSGAKLTALINFLQKGGKTALGDPYQSNITVFRCVNQIATTLAQVPMSLYRGEDKVSDGPTYDLLRRPNPLMGYTKFIHTVVAQELLHGASYVLLDAVDSRGVPRALLPLTPRMVVPIRPSENLYDLRGWRLGLGEGASQVAPDRIARFEYAISDEDPLMPVSPLEVASMAVQTDHLSAVWNKAVLENSGAPAGILKWTGEGRLDEKDAGLIRDQWMESYGGAAKAESIAVLGNNFDFQPVGQGAKDMELSEGRRWNLAEIARAFNVPTLYLNEYSATGLSDAGLKVQERLFYHNTIQPIAAVFVEVMNRLVVQPIEPDLKLVWEWGSVEALREDYGGKLKHADQLWRLGYPINEVNTKLELGMPSLPWGDDAFVQAQMITAATAVEQSSMLFDQQNPAANGDGVEEEVEVEVEVEEEPDSRLGSRAVSVPSFVKENARRGLKYHTQGKSGDGVTDKTLREARGMVDGSVSEDKVMRMAAWFKRHESDLSATKNSDQNDENYPGAGAVAWLLWGGNPTSDPMRASEWADRKMAQLSGEKGEDEGKSIATLISAKGELDPLCKSMVSRMRRILMKQRSAMINAVSDEAVGSLMLRVDTASRLFDLDEFVDTLLPQLRDANSAGVSSVLDVAPLSSGAPRRSLEADEEGRICVDAYVDKRRGQLALVAERIKDRTNHAMLTAYADGRGAEEICQAIREAFNVHTTTQKCKLIARSESGAAFNKGRVDSMKILGVRSHTWMTPKGGCPASHDDLHGSEERLGDRFSENDRLSFPCDPKAEPSAVVDCRCLTIPAW